MKTALKQCMKARQYRDALDLILRVRASDALEVIELAADQLSRIPADVISARIPMAKRLAILGGTTTHFVAPLIRLFAAQRGIALTVYESDFGLYESEIWSPSPGFVAAKPDLIHFHISSRNLPFPRHADEPERLVSEEAERLLRLYRSAVQRYGCPVIINNFETEPERCYGSLDAVLPGSRNNMIRSLNAALVSDLPAHVHVNDVEQLSSTVGKRRWSDARTWNDAKVAVSFDCQPHYADRIAALCAALFGKSKKCLVLDLDNTLWGGVIGDDGLGGIRIGAGHAEGEAFAQFQEYVKALKNRGVLLAVASKNEPEIARAAFSQHPDMVLKESDFSSFVATWEPKDRSVEQIAHELNIGLDALVFFDDNPAERELVRSSFPAVTVIDVPDDPALYVAALDEANLFDTVSVTSEDRARGQFFQQNQAREQLESRSTDHGEFLRRLEMRAAVEPITDRNLTRSVQLINKTNQFNLTVRRMTEAEVQSFAQSADAYTSTVRLEDKFGSYGLISVVIGCVAGDTLQLENWVMSCRVFKRGVEVLEMERLLAFCRTRGLRTIVGRYVATPSNKLVSRHFEELGFVPAGNDQDSIWHFELDVQKANGEHAIST